MDTPTKEEFVLMEFRITLGRGSNETVLKGRKVSKISAKKTYTHTHTHTEVRSECISECSLVIHR